MEHRNSPSRQKTLLFYSSKQLLFLLLVLFSLSFSTKVAAQKKTQEKEAFKTDLFELDNQNTSIEVSYYNISATKSADDYNNSSFGSSSITNCNNNSQILAINHSQDDSLNTSPCHNTDTLEICFRVNQFDCGPTAQYLHALVPDFGCIVPWSVSPDGEPGDYTVPFTNNSGAGQWIWVADSIVLYNNLNVSNPYHPPGYPVGAGWFYQSASGANGNCLSQSPVCNYGDLSSCENPGFTWEVCFFASALCTFPNPDPQTIPCEITFRTYSDSETGSWTQPGCQNDQPVVYPFELFCGPCLAPHHGSSRRHRNLLWRSA